MELMRAFEARFVTYSRVPRPLDSLLSMSMREGETLKNYFDRYQELYNEIDGDFKDVAVRTFQVGLPTHSNLWKSLTIKPYQSTHQLMDRIEEHERVEDNQNQSKGKAKVFTTDQRDNQAKRYGPSHPRREFYNQAPHNLVGPKWQIQCLRSRSTKCWKRSRMSHTLNGQIEWEETPPREIRIFIVIIIRTEVILRRIIGLCNSSSINWSKLGS